MISVFFSGHSDILTGLIRRQRRFADLAKATLLGNAVGIAASVAIALLGGGVWALIAQRLLVVVARALLLQARADILILPGRALGALRDIARYGGLSLVDRLTDNLTYLVFNYAVGGLYGLNVLGYVNMAMRLVEPLRSAIGATGHNLAFSLLSRLQNEPERLSARARTIVSHAALAIALAVLVFATGLGPISVGLSRIAGDIGQAAVAILAPARIAGWPRERRFFALAPAWSLAALMGFVVAHLHAALPHWSQLATLALLIGAGIAAYAVFLVFFAREQLSGLAILFPRAKPAQG